MTKEQRRYPRVECTGDAGVQIAPSGSCCAAKIVDLSAGGCLLVLKQPQCLTQDTTVELTFTINNLPFRTLGQVKAKRSDKAIGFQFRSLSDSLRRQLEELLQQLIENRPARSLLQGLREKRHYPRIKRLSVNSADLDSQ
jgi:c-di-GMP-binding flagellar brake protein YcgR